MSTTRHDAPGRATRPVDVLWLDLPVLLVGSVPVAAAWSLVRSWPAGPGWLVILGIGFGIVPAFAPLLRGCQVLLSGEHFGLRHLLPALSRGFLPTLRVTAPPTLAVVLSMLALDLWHLSRQPWMLASLGVGMTVSLVALYVAVVGLPYNLRTGAGLVEGWLVSCYVATRNPVPVLAVLSAVALAVWAAAYLSFALVLLLPAPLALLWASATGTATERSQARLAGYDGRAGRP